MKPSIWDILTGVVLLAILCLAGAFTLIFINPSAAFNPFPPPTPIPPVVVTIPTTTPTVVLRELPATWTPTPSPEVTATLRVLKPSSTIPPTATLYLAPTGTNTPTQTRTGIPTRADARCYVVDENPVDDATFAPGQEFDKRWNVKNNSGNTWRADAIDIRYVSGTKMQTSSDVYDLLRNVGNQETYDFTVRMRAPSSPGTYTSQWSFSDGSKSVCDVFVRIVVK